MRSKRKPNDVLTTGEIARACSVSPHLAATWIDKGLMHGHRLPISGDRRVSRAEVIRFIRGAGMDVPAWLSESRRLLVISPSPLLWLPNVPGWQLEQVSDLFMAGIACAAARPDAIVFDFATGRTECLHAAERIAATPFDRVRSGSQVDRVRPGSQSPLLIALAYEDEPDAEGLAATFALVLRNPDAIALQARLTTEAQP